MIHRSIKTNHSPLFLLLALLGMIFTFAPTPASAADKDPAPLVDSQTTKNNFPTITAQDMDMLRGKKILFASRSFGLNLCNGLKSLAAQDKKYAFLDSYERFDVVKAGGKLDIIPADIFKTKNFVHFLATYWPHTKRVEEMDDLLRKPPHNFGQTVDVVIIFFHTALPNNFEQYATKMDALRRDFPNIRFIYVTAGFQADTRAKENENAHAWSDMVRARYKGKVPIYDLGAILSDDFRAGHAYCPEYSKDPAGVHPNTDAGQTMMAKGFLLVLRDACKWTPPTSPPTLPATSPTAKTPDTKTETLAATHPDAIAVRPLLDANGLKQKTVASVAVVEQGRIVKLYLQEGGIKQLPDAIGTLTQLRVLHVYGDRALPHPLLEKISPALARCTQLEDLLLNHNELTTLPPEITALKKLKSLSLADNRLKNLSPKVEAWAKQFDPQGLARQRP